jgi:glycerophosphoryl diester phosphodiesterase
VDARKVYDLDKSLMISVTIRNDEEFQRIVDTKIPFSNLIVFTGTTLADSSLYHKIHQQGALTILGTMGNIDNSAKAKGSKVYQNCIATGVNVLATDYPVEAAVSVGITTPVAPKSIAATGSAPNKERKTATKEKKKRAVGN